MHAAPEIDRVVERWVSGHRVHGIDRTALALTHLGGTPLVLTVSALVGAVGWWRTRRWSLLAVCVAGEVAVEAAARVLKLVVGRPRPPFDQAVVALANSSFPAAHVARAVYAGCLVCALVRPGPARRLAVGVAAALVTVVAWTRVDLGAHWLTDTIGAAPLGLLAAIWPVRRLRTLPTTRPELARRRPA